MRSFQTYEEEEPRDVPPENMKPPGPPLSRVTPEWKSEVFRKQQGSTVLAPGQRNTNRYSDKDRNSRACRLS